MLSHQAGFAAPPGMWGTFSGVSQNCLQPTHQHLNPVGTYNKYRAWTGSMVMGRGTHGPLQQQEELAAKC